MSWCLVGSEMCIRDRSTVRINGSDIGRLAAKYLMDRAEGQVVQKPIVDVGFSIVERGSS
jgi:LacI family gluconate utilization system Gnt-I transcriptional repressor